MDTRTPHFFRPTLLSLWSALLLGLIVAGCGGGGGGGGGGGAKSEAAPPTTTPSTSTNPSSIAMVQSIPAGDPECPAGGERIYYGIDDNGNGVLDVIERDGFVVICNGEGIQPVVDLWVDSDWVGLPAGFDPDGFLPATAIGTDAFGTIQEAIDGASPGQTIGVAGGLYAEDLTISQGVVLAGAGSAVTTIKGIATVPGLSFPLAAPNIDIQANDVAIFGFTIESPAVGATDYSSGIVLTGTNIEIRDNQFKVATGDGSQGIQTWARDNAPVGLRDISGLHIHRNTFTHLSLVGLGIFEGVFVNPQSDPVSAPIVIEDNVFSGGLFRAVFTERSDAVIQNNTINTSGSGVDTGIAVVTSDSSPIANVTVQNNIISGAFPNGLKIGNTSGLQTSTNIIVQGNDISTGATGIWVRNTPDPAGIAINSNSLAGNATAGLKFDGTTGILNAENNWWGAADGPSGCTGCLGAGVPIVEAVPGSVDFAPFLTVAP